jgi:hypothetical protein
VAFVRFLRDYRVRDSSGRVYRAGDVEEMDDGSARHFVARGAAECV